ncbi:MAG: glycine C-acetyltransferase [Gammaproteobacteria bacterium]|nr:glycine C-acetyltransferase [Gammaproteobacteria bacterium]
MTLNHLPTAPLAKLSQRLKDDIVHLHEQGLYKHETPISSQQQAAITCGDKQLINLCANNYLGLANHPKLIDAAQSALHQHGFGMASVRFICGTQELHKQLETRLAAFLGFEDSILYSSCFDANTGLFETLLDAQDAIISDSLNHASIIDGVRLCKAQRLRYANNNMQELEQCLIQSQESRTRLIVTDGVFSMDGSIANLTAICNLAEQYNALVMVDDSHAVGFMGNHGRGSHEYCDVMGRVHIMTGTFGKALGGASGGYVAANKTVVEWLRQRSRPYLFSNALAPPICAATIAALDIVEQDQNLRQRLISNTQRLRDGLTMAGFELLGKDHAIVPILLGDAQVASQFAQQMQDRGIHVVSFSFPVVPQGQARIRTQMSAALNEQQIDQALEAFIAVGRSMGVIV